MSHMDRSRDAQRDLIEEAQNWHSALKRAPTARQRAAFLRWVQQSPEHLRAWLMVAALEAELRGLDAADHFDLSSLRSNASGDAASPSHPASRFGGRWRGWWALAAALVVGTLISVIYFAQNAERNQPTYTTEIGERRVLPLPDGSTVELNTATRVKVHFTAETREVILLWGEAMFAV